MLLIDQDQFIALREAGFNRIPVVLETFADLDTPLSIYLKLANKPYSYLLESVLGGERFGRYSFIGLPAKTRLVVHGQHVSVWTHDTLTEQANDTNPLTFIEHYMARFRVASLTKLPRFSGGLVGYFGYDTVRHIEPRLLQHTPRPDPLNTPDMLLLLSDELVVVDNLSGKIMLLVYADPAQPNAYEQACKRLQQHLTALRQPLTIPQHAPVSQDDPISLTDKTHFKAAVNQAKEYIRAGDIMQVVLSQRMTRDFEASPLALYRSLRTINPSPYMFYYDFGDFHVVGASPEILVRLESRQVTVRPIAGTRHRGQTPEQDAALADDLLNDAKECAEHLMLLDLGRNDIGRIAKTGSIQITQHMHIERYSHVMHIVSNIEAQLQDALSAMDVLRATFPAGTVSGAAKVRAMEIIDELETVKRGIYSGAVGYLGFHGDMDLAIALRTAVIKEGTLHVQAGAGIVADSDPDAEWQETCNKAKAILQAAQLACAGLDTHIAPLNHV